MLKLSKRVEYALQFLTELEQSDDDSVLSLREFSTKNNISFLYLQRIVRQLMKSELVNSRRGASGGYYLLNPKEVITLRSVVEAIEGPYGATPCHRGESCPQSTGCTIKKTMGNLSTIISKQLDTITIADLS